MTPNELKIARRMLGYSKVQLGKLLGRSRSQIWEYETGRAEIPPWLPLAIRGLNGQRGAAASEVARLMAKLEAEE